MDANVARSKRNGLAVLWDVLVAPDAAFVELRDHTHWGWAFLVVALLGMAGAYLQVPAGQHVMLATIAHDPKFSQMDAQQAQSARTVALMTQAYLWLFYPIIALIGITIAAAIYLVITIIGKGSSTFARLFGFATNVAVLNFGIAYFLIGVIATLHGPQNFSTQSELIGVMPSLGWLVPASSIKLQAFFAAFNPFQIWSLILIALGLQSVGGIRPVLAWSTAVGLALIGAAIAAAVTRG